MEGSKVCASCGEEKPAHGFQRCNRYKSGLQSYCKACRKAKEQERPFNKAVRNAKQRALKAGIPFELTEQYLEDIWTGTCPVFGFRFNLPGIATRTAQTATLDRIKPEAGYVPGNVIWISDLANRIKQEATSDDILAVGNWLQQTEEEIKRHEDTD